MVQSGEINPGKLDKISKLLSHRGPDDEGFLLFNLKNRTHLPATGDDSIPLIGFPRIHSIPSMFSSAFCHRRLSIIDLSPSGHQPLSYNENKLWIILNGEIYNYVELKEELLRKGYYFKSKTDTEVILASYLEWGEKCIEHFNGMWAFAIWDQEKKIIFLSRDRLGVKPLYYFFHNNSFIFSSEVKGIWSYLDKILTLNEFAMYKFALRGEVYVGEDDTTLFNEVKQLLPGYNLIYNEQSVEIYPYWKLKRVRNYSSFKDNVERFKELFQSSIAYRLRSDVEVGSCLSGGLDSSSIVSYGSDKFHKRFHTFSAIWPGEPCDESFFINKVNEKWQCCPYSFTPNLDNLLELIEKEVWHQEIPLSGPSVLAQWSVIEKAKKNDITVLLDGQGADEILGGYPVYLSTYVREMITRFKWMELIKYRNSLKLNNFYLKQLAMTLYNRHLPDSIYKIPLSNKFQQRFNHIETRLDTKFLRLTDYLITEIQHSTLPLLLHLEDRNSMAHSVEARVPFLDYRLVEFCVNIPSEQKIHGGLSKIILREAMQDHIPTEILNRKDKIGFDTPIEAKYLVKKGQFHKQIWEYIESSALTEIEIFDYNKIKATNWKWANFAVLSAAIFLNKYIR